MRNLSYLLILTAGLLHGQTYPGAVYTPLVARDNISTALSASMLVGDSTATVSSGTGWAPNMVAYICDGGTTGANKCTGTFEAMLVTNVVGNTLTVTRGYGGTSAHAHTSGRTISNSPAAVYNTSVTNEVVAIETALGAGLSNIAGYRANVYDFAPQTPGGTLSAGAQSITLTPCPYGVAGAFTTSYLYLVGGTGTAEAVPIVGGTCTSGATTGTVIVTVANSHSGAWTVKSASGGFQEALRALPNGTGTVILTATGTIQVHAKVTMPAGRQTIDGQNIFNYALQRAADYPNGNMLEFPASAVTVVQNMWIQNSVYPTAQTSGAALHYANNGISRPNAIIKNVTVIGGYIGYDFDGVGQIDWTSGNYTADANAAQFAGVWIHDTSGAPLVPVNIQMSGGNFSLTSTARGLVIYAADLAQFTNLAFGGGSTQVYLSAIGANDYISGLIFNGCVWDNPVSYAVKIDALRQMSNISFVGGSISGDGNQLTGTAGIDLCYANTCSPVFTDWAVTGMKISGMGGSAIAVGAGAQQGAITGGVFHSNNARPAPGSDGGIKLDTGVAELTISGVTITSTNIAYGTHAWALGTIGAASDLSITGNSFCGNTNPISVGGALTNSVIANNACLNSGVTFVNIPANMPNGTLIYVTDSNAGCTAGGGAGQLCKRVAGAWTN